MRRIVSILLSVALLMSLCPTLYAATTTADARTPIYNGDGYADYLAETVLAEIDTATGTDRSRIWAVYSWLLENCAADSDAAGSITLEDGDLDAFVETANAELTSGTICLDGSEATVLQYTASFGADMLQNRVGNSAHFAYALKLLLNHLGYSCEVVWGTFRSADGTTYEHKWNTVEVRGVTYWLDARKDYDSTLRTGSPTAQYFMISDETAWSKEHLLPTETVSTVAAADAEPAETDETSEDPNAQLGTNSSDITVTVDGEAVSFPDAQPFLSADSRTMLPLAAVAAAMGCTTDWDGDTRTVRITDEAQGLTMYLAIGQVVMAVEDDATGALYGFQSDVAPEIHANRTYLPIRIVAEVFGYTVSWDKASHTVSLTSGGYPMALTAAEPLESANYAAWSALLDAFD